MNAGGADPNLALVTGLYRTTNAVVRELDQRLGRDYGVTFIQAVTLLAVDSFDRPQPHLVADYLSQQSQTVTGVLDRLERAGHLTRQRDMSDRRAVRLELTPGGQALVAGIRETLPRHVNDVVSGTPTAIRRELTASLVKLEQSVRAASPR
jgi:DNA-binding MarR family transcriptional regulator